MHKNSSNQLQLQTANNKGIAFNNGGMHHSQQASTANTTVYNNATIGQQRYSGVSTMAMEEMNRKQQRNNSTEAAARPLFRNTASANHQQVISTFNNSVENQQQTGQQKNGSTNPVSSSSYQNMSQAIMSAVSSSADDRANDYQSILLTRYLKEPRLPPSSTYYNNNSRKKKSTVSRGPRPFAPNQQQLGSSKNEEQRIASQKPVSSPSKGQAASYTSSMGQQRKRMAAARVFGVGAGKADISYRNQTEIMRKIFGNEQSYQQAKSLLVRQGPPPPQTTTSGNAKENLLMKQQQQFDQTKSPKGNIRYKDEAIKPSSSPIYMKNDTMERRIAQGNQFQERSTKSPHTGPEDIILAKSQQKPHNPYSGEEIIENTSSYHQAPVLKTERHQAAAYPPHASGSNNDQVEKAIFDLQDVKNNYFQEKSLFDQKIQQIQIKQNSTMSNGFGMKTAYNRTATSGFLPTTAGSQRPMTQGGQLLRNQALMNDNNILKGDLESVTKEDLRERLVVAEMVMKKLFQRNKDLEDQMAAVKERTIEADMSVDFKQQQREQARSQIASPKSSNTKDGFDLDSIDINNDLNESKQQSRVCSNCLDLRKELTSKEKEMQERINDLSSQLLKKTEAIGKSQHLEYLQQRLEETMAEAKRHFGNYISVRNMYNAFLESRLNSSNVQGGMKGQKIHNDILTMLKKNLEIAEMALLQEKDQMKLSFAKIAQQVAKKDQLIQKRDNKIKSLKEEIERRRFIEAKVQKYVKGLINKNKRFSGFLDQIKSSAGNGIASIRQDIEDFQRSIENQQEGDGGESTENEEEGHSEEEEGSLEGEAERNISVEVNDL